MNTEILRALQDWIEQQIFPHPAIWAEQNSPRPKKDHFAALKVLSVVTSGSESRRAVGTDDTTHLSFQDFTFSVTIYGQNALILANKIQNSVNLQSVNDLFKSRNLTCVDTSAARDITTQLDTGFEKRANIEAFFRSVVELTETITSIETVEYSGDVDNGRVTMATSEVRR